MSTYPLDRLQSRHQASEILKAKAEVKVDRLVKFVVLTAMVMPLSACSVSEGLQDNVYKFEPDGGVEIEDRNVYSALGEVSFNINQKYKITLVGERNKEFHYLIMNFKKKIGNRNVEYTKGVSIPISDGSQIIECKKYYSVKIEKENEVESPICEIEVIGAIYPNRHAKMIN